MKIVVTEGTGPAHDPRSWRRFHQRLLISIAATLWAWRMRRPRQVVSESIVHTRKESMI